MKQRIKITPLSYCCYFNEPINKTKLKLNSSTNNNSISAKMEFSRKLSQICIVKYKPPQFV